MAITIRTPFDAFKEVEKRLKYKFWDKERERSNRAAALAAAGMTVPRNAPRCLRNHDTTAWVGPPHDEIRAYVCLHCHAAACEPEIRDRGFDFETIPDWELNKIFDLDLQRQAQGNPKNFYIPNPK